jgi:hypothetical protein
MMKIVKIAGRIVLLIPFGVILAVIMFVFSLIIVTVFCYVLAIIALVVGPIPISTSPLFASAWKVIVSLIILFLSPLIVCCGFYVITRIGSIINLSVEWAMGDES